MDKTTKIIIGIVIAIIIIGGVWWGISKKSTTSEEMSEKETIKIGVSAALTGEVSIWGQNGLAGILLATEETNKDGGVNGKRIEIIPEDDKSLPAEAANAFNKLVNIDKVTAIIGASGSGASASAVAVAQNASLPFVIAFASAPHLTMTGDYIFRVTPSDAFQGKYSAEFVYNEMKAKKVALIYVKNDWGEGVQKVFKKRFIELGGEIVYLSGVLPTDNDFRTEIAKVKKSDAELLYFPVYPDVALSFFKQMREVDLNLPIVAGDAIEGEEVIENDYAEGIIYTLPKINVPDDFKEKIRALSGFENLKVTIAAPLSYDATKILFSAMEKSGTDREKIRNELIKISYKGVSNPVIEFDENGDLKAAVFEAKIIKDKQSFPYKN